VTASERLRTLDRRMKPDPIHPFDSDFGLLRSVLRELADVVELAELEAPESSHHDLQFALDDLTVKLARVDS
jgi:hypothetical protein